MSRLSIQPGASVSFREQSFVIVRILSLTHVLAERSEDKERMKLPISELNPPSEENETPALDLITDKEWEIAKMRHGIIEPLIECHNRLPLIKKIEEEHNIHRSTIYHWLERYESTFMLSSLVPNRKLGGKGQSRLLKSSEELLQSIIDDHYLNSQKLNISRLYIELKMVFKKQNLTPPHINTVRNRINSIDEEKIIKARYGKKVSDQKFSEITGPYKEATYPLSVVQIDHTLLDIILVDNETRQVIGRPWVTLSIDVYSRAITGMYLSFDPPSAMNVGLCLSNAILPKEKLLLKHGIEGEWPCWGLMKIIHADNAREFKGKMITKASEEYGMNLQWRPVATPHWGGHIERLIGTIVGEIHSLPGTTFSNVSDRVNYDSEKKAALSLQELEKYMLIFITQVYHKRKHSALGVSPLFKYTEGLMGSSEMSGHGLPIKISDEDKLTKDFMPYLERSVQNYGVKIDNITYYHDVLRRWINSKEVGSKTEKRKLIFRRDPRDITILYFLDPEVKKYYPIPCRNLSRPSISIWEYREAVKSIARANNEIIDEDAIFEAYDRLNSIKDSSLHKTRSVKRKKFTKEGRRNVHGQLNESISQFSEGTILNDITPFDEIDHGAS